MGSGRVVGARPPPFGVLGFIFGVFMVHPWSETGVCLEQGKSHGSLLTDTSGGRPGRRVAPLRISII